MLPYALCDASLLFVCGVALCVTIIQHFVLSICCAMCGTCLLCEVLPLQCFAEDTLLFCERTYIPYKAVAHVAICIRPIKMIILKCVHLEP